jgi:hypothetical protein
LFAAVSRVGSAEYEIGCRADAASKRPSLAEGTDSVIISTKIVAVQPADPATIDPEGDGFIQKVLTKAKFVYKAGTSNKGKYLIVAFRWNYTKAPDLAGPWTEAQVILIS